MNYTNFTFSGQLYKYDMDSLLAIYAQAPNAKFIADFDTWKRVGRSVTLGSKAIKILRQKETGAFIMKMYLMFLRPQGKTFLSLIGR